MQINCPQCGTEIEADDINLDRLVAKCRRCHAVFGFADTIGNRSFARDTPSLDVPLPARMTLDHTGEGLEIRRRWFSPAVLAMAFFALFWNGFIIMWMSMAVFAGAGPMALFGSLHAAVGIVLLYGTLGGLLNTTTVAVNSMALTVRHRPVPFPGKQLEPGAIRQLYCKEKSRHSRRSTSVSYELHAVTSEGKHEKLVTGLAEPEQALFLEQQIERYLRITDQPVRGELAR